MKLFLAVQLFTLNIMLGQVTTMSRNIDTLKDEQTIRRAETLQSLFIEASFNNKSTGTATGFIIKSKTQYYLITNWHVVTNKDPRTLQWINPNNKTTPNKISIFYRRKNNIGEITIKQEMLINESGRRYVEYGIGKEIGDVVAIPLKDTAGDICIFPLNYKNTCDSILLRPTESVFIVGFPLGFSSGLSYPSSYPLSYFPIYKHGTIASEPDVNEGDRPIMLVDADVYRGMSGSQVYYINNGIIVLKNEKKTLNLNAYFLGILSSQNEKIKINSIWKSTYLKKFFDSLP